MLYLILIDAIVVISISNPSIQKDTVGAHFISSNCVDHVDVPYFVYTHAYLHALMPYHLIYAIKSSTVIALVHPKMYWCLCSLIDYYA